MKWNNLNTYKSQVDELRNLNAYDILKVSRDASIEEIKLSYRNLVKIYHPDISHSFLKDNNEEIIKIINDAYEIILKERNEH